MTKAGTANVGQRLSGRSAGVFDRGIPALQRLRVRRFAVRATAIGRWLPATAHRPI